MAYRNDPRRNGSGCFDMTAYEAIRNIDDEAKFKKLLETIFNICELSGFHLENRLELRDKKTGKVWR